MTTTEAAAVYVKDLDMLITVQLLDDPFAVLPLGKLCEEHGPSVEWNGGQSPAVTPRWPKSPIASRKLCADSRTRSDC